MPSCPSLERSGPGSCSAGFGGTEQYPSPREITPAAPACGPALGRWCGPPCRRAGRRAAARTLCGGRGLPARVAHLDEARRASRRRAARDQATPPPASRRRALLGDATAACRPRGRDSRPLVEGRLHRAACLVPAREVAGLPVQPARLVVLGRAWARVALLRPAGADGGALVPHDRRALAGRAGRWARRADRPSGAVPRDPERRAAGALCAAA